MKDHFRKLFVRDKHVCPWWCCFTFDNFLRKLLHNSEKILQPYVAEGNTILDIGPGMGYFTIPLARMVGEKGKVIAADIQRISKKTRVTTIDPRCPVRPYRCPDIEKRSHCPGVVSGSPFGLRG